MPITRFLVLQRQLPTLEAEEEARALAVTHTGKPKERLEALAEVIKRQGRGGPKPAGVTSSVLVTQHRQVAKAAGPEDDIRALRERQKAAAERLKAERGKA